MRSIFTLALKMHLLHITADKAVIVIATLQEVNVRGRLGTDVIRLTAIFSNKRTLQTGLLAM